MRVILFDDLITELTDTRLVVQDLPPQEKRREEDISGDRRDNCKGTDSESVDIDSDCPIIDRIMNSLPPVIK
jgi:hypothetical protein